MSQLNESQAQTQKEQSVVNATSEVASVEPNYHRVLEKTALSGTAGRIFHKFALLLKPFSHVKVKEGTEYKYPGVSSKNVFAMKRFFWFTRKYNGQIQRFECHLEIMATQN